MFEAILAFFKSIPAAVQLIMAIMSLLKTAWQAYQTHLIDVASKEAADKLKQAAIKARTGDTSDLENWFSPGRNNAKPEPQPIITP